MPKASKVLSGPRQPTRRQFLFRFALLVIFRVVQWIVAIESDVFVLLRRLFTNKSKSGSNPDVIEIQTILARFRLTEKEIARPTDFIAFFSEAALFSVLEDRRWQLYAVDDRYAYFVEMPFSMHEYAFKFCGDIGEGQFTEAQRLARVRWTDFVGHAEKWRHFPGKVVALTAILQAGSDILCTLVEQISAEHTAPPDPDAIVVYSHPDAFTLLASQAEFYDNIGAEQVRIRLQAMMRYFCRHQAKGQTYFIRLRPACIRLVPHIHAIAPQVMHVFMARDQFQHSISKFLHPQDPMFTDFAKMAIVLRKTCRPLEGLLSICEGEQVAVNSVQPSSVIELAVALIASGVVSYKRQKRFYCCVVFLETLIEKPRENLRTLLAAIGLPELDVSQAVIEAAGVLGARDQTGVVELSDDQRLIIQKTTQLLEYYSD